MTPPKPDEKLLPCPFCGTVELMNMTGQCGMGISCLNENCAAYMANVPAHKWNTRTPNPRLAELERDKERLDWLEANNALVNRGHLTEGNPQPHCWNGKSSEYNDNHFWGETYREAIDKAITKEKEGE